MVQTKEDRWNLVRNEKGVFSYFNSTTGEELSEEDYKKKFNLQ